MAKAAEIDFADVSAPANLDVAWIHGSPAAKYNTDPDIQVHAYDEHTYILRQNMAVHYEAPFMFLLLGRSAALLLDTGATADPRFFPLRRTVDQIIDGWLARHPPVTHLLGCHIEMTTEPGVDYPAGWTYQPDEPPLELTTDHLGEIQATLKAHDFQPGRYVLPRMIITPVADG